MGEKQEYTLYPLKIGLVNTKSLTLAALKKTQKNSLPRKKARYGKRSSKKLKLNTWIRPQSVTDSILADNLPSTTPNSVTNKGWSLMRIIFL